MWLRHASPDAADEAQADRDAIATALRELDEKDREIERLNREGAADKALIKSITHVCIECYADGSCEVCNGVGVVPDNNEEALRDKDREIERLRSALTEAECTSTTYSKAPCIKCGAMTVRVDVDSGGSDYVIDCDSCHDHYRTDGPDA